MVDTATHLPDSVSEVRFWVPPYAVGPAVADALAGMTSLEVVQTLTAGVDNLRDAVPDGVTLCRGRGIHETSTAELAVTLTLASLRGVPQFVRAHDRGAWEPGWRPALADRRVLIVGTRVGGRGGRGAPPAVRGHRGARRPHRPRRRARRSPTCPRCCPRPTS